MIKMSIFSSIVGLALLVVAPACSGNSSSNDGSGGDASSGDDGNSVDASGGGDAAAPFSDGGMTTTDGGKIDPPPPTPIVGACSSLAAIGTFEEITPPVVAAEIAADAGAGGTFAIAADPVNQGTLYAGTVYEKVWKSTDCGATWTNISTGRNAALVNSGMNWTFAVDPQDPQTVYTNSGYGSGTNGLFKSTNGGVDWDVIWPPAAQPDLSAAFTYNFANVIAIDPSNHQHVLLTFHEQCLAPHPSTCIAESMDGGGSWRLIDGQPGWDGNEGQVIFFLGNSTTWLWGSQDSGFWRGTGSGTSWAAIPSMTTSHLQGSQLVQTTSGAFVMAAADGIWRSADGTAASWSIQPNTGPIMGGVVDDGTALFAANCYYPGFCAKAAYSTSSDDGKTWTAMTSSPDISMGGTFAYDPGHGVLYSSNGHSGMWRVRVR